MDPAETSSSRSPSPKVDPTAAPNEAELSRIAREAVHQAPDPRLDRQLARLGVGETPEPAPSQPVQAPGPSVVTGAELERLDARLRHMELLVVAVIAVVGILALIEVILLVR